MTEKRMPKGWHLREQIVKKYREKKSLHKTADAISILMTPNHETISPSVIRRILVLMDEPINKPCQSSNKRYRIKK